MTINLYNTDCMQALRDMPDNMYDLAIVDPPYGIQQAKGISYGKWARDIHTEKNWDDEIPPREYFIELIRVSKNQVIWGGNYFIDYLYNTRCMLVWNKKNGGNPMSDCELAWTSFDSSVRMFTYNHIQDFNAGIQRIHPTQKPIDLYEWILERYAKQGDRILDTHLGSGSIALACHTMGYSLDAYEIDAEYFAAASARLHEHQRQIKLFT
jgi:site-specific DNA-methyltransferase (adenine-specific)